jgi:hypothetical protein
VALRWPLLRHNADGFHGKTIALSLENYYAEARARGGARAWLCTRTLTRRALSGRRFRCGRTAHR